MHSWTLKGDKATLTIDPVVPIHRNNPHYAVLAIERPGAALANTGFDEIALNGGEKYDLSVFARVPQGTSNKLQIRLVDDEGNICGETSLNISSRQWKTYKAVITAKNTADTHLEIIPQSAGELHLDMISLFPQNTFKGRKNGLRKDLAKVWDWGITNISSSAKILVLNRFRYLQPVYLVRTLPATVI